MRYLDALLILLRIRSSHTPRDSEPYIVIGLKAARTSRLLLKQKRHSRYGSIGRTLCCIRHKDHSIPSYGVIVEGSVALLFGRVCMKDRLAMASIRERDLQESHLPIEDEPFKCPNLSTNFLFFRRQSRGYGSED